MESITSLKSPVAEEEIKANKKASSACTVTNEAIYSFKGNMCSIGICLGGSYSFFCMTCVSYKAPHHFAVHNRSDHAPLRNMCSTIRIAHLLGANKMPPTASTSSNSLAGLVVKKKLNHMAFSRAAKEWDIFLFVSPLLRVAHVLFFILPMVLYCHWTPFLIPFFFHPHAVKTCLGSAFFSWIY